MPLRVPLYPPEIDGSDEQNRFRSALPIIGADWQALGSLSAYLVGRGATLVSASGAGASFAEGNYVGISDGATEVYRFYTWPHEQNHVRLWDITLSRWPLNTAVFGTLSLSTGATRSFYIPADAPEFFPITFELKETLDNTLPSECILTVEHDTDSHDTAQVFVDSIVCTEAPRVNLDNFGALNVLSLASLKAGRLIYEDSTETKSANAVCKAAAVALTEARRACLFSYYNPHGISTTSGTFEDLLSVSLMPRKRYNNQTVQAIESAIRIDAIGGDGEARVTMTSGDTFTVTVNEGVNWYTDHIDAQVDDMDRLPIDGGFPNSGVADVATLAARVTTATSLVAYGFCNGEDT